jgi:hypothetical protein
MRHRANASRERLLVDEEQRRMIRRRFADLSGGVIPKKKNIPGAARSWLRRSLCCGSSRHVFTRLTAINPQGDIVGFYRDLGR